MQLDNSLIAMGHRRNPETVMPFQADHPIVIGDGKAVQLILPALLCAEKNAFGMISGKHGVRVPGVVIFKRAAFRSSRNGAVRQAKGPVERRVDGDVPFRRIDGSERQDSPAPVRWRRVAPSR